MLELFRKKGTSPVDIVVQIQVTSSQHSYTEPDKRHVRILMEVGRIIFHEKGLAWPFTQQRTEETLHIGGT